MSCRHFGIWFEVLPCLEEEKLSERLENAVGKGGIGHKLQTCKSIGLFGKG